MSDIEIREYLESCVSVTAKQAVNEVLRGHLDVILENRENNRGVLAVLITLLVKKSVSPGQDITKHQHKMKGGFSARGFDAKHITPFLKEQNFPYMGGGAGALTRSLEQAVPFNKDYTGAIRPQKVKDAFLAIVNSVQNEREDPKRLLVYLFQGLTKYRDIDDSIKLAKPVNLSISDTVEKLRQHFALCGSGAARLPQLAIYAAYRVLVNEIERYKNCQLCELQPLQSADEKSGFLGDIQVNKEGDPFEAVELKHNIELTAETVDTCYQKLRNTQLKVYYLLSTNEKLSDATNISKKVVEIYRNHGCQVIVNGVFNTLRYYLRLMKDHNKFLKNYVELIEQESKYEVKEKWNAVCQ